METRLYFELTGLSRNSNSNKWSSFRVHDIRLGIGAKDPKDFFTIDSDPYTPVKGDKYYFLDKVNIPRVKLKDFHEANGTRTVRDVNQASHIFIGDKTVELWTHYFYRYEVATVVFKKFIELHENCFDKMELENIRQALDCYTEDVILLHNGGARLIEDVSCPNYQAFITDPCVDTDGICSYATTTYFIKNDYLVAYNEVKDSTLKHESCLSSVLNGTNAAIIDEEMFDRLAAMFDSNDKDNHVLAMEIMANSQYDKSIYYIEILFKNYNMQMYDTPSKRHVNFKSLLTYVGKQGYFNTRLDDVVKSLIDKKVLQHEMLTDLMHRYKNEIINSGDTTYFKVKNITVIEEVHKIVNKNFTYNLEADFVSEVEEVISLEEVIPKDFKTYNPTDEEETFTELSEEPPVDEFEEEEEELPGTISEIETVEEVVNIIEEEVFEVPVVEPKKEEDESSIDWF